MITKDVVKYIAGLSRIHIPDDQLEGMTKSLEGILNYVDKLSQVDVKDVPPTTHVLQLQDVYRDDKVKPSLPQDEVMKMAADHHNGSFKVPKVIE